MVTENGVTLREFVSLDGRVHDSGRIDYMTRYLRELGPWVYESAAHAPSEKARRNA